MPLWKQWGELWDGQTEAEMKGLFCGWWLNYCVHLDQPGKYLVCSDLGCADNCAACPWCERK